MRHQQWQKKEKIHFVFFPLFIYLPLIRCHRCRRFIVVSLTSRLAITQRLKIFPFKIIVRYHFTRWNLFFCSISPFQNWRFFVVFRNTSPNAIPSLYTILSSRCPHPKSFEVCGNLLDGPSTTPRHLERVAGRRRVCCGF